MRVRSVQTKQVSWVLCGRADAEGHCRFTASLSQFGMGRSRTQSEWYVPTTTPTRNHVRLHCVPPGGCARMNVGVRSHDGRSQKNEMPTDLTTAAPTR